MWTPPFGKGFYRINSASITRKRSFSCVNVQKLPTSLVRLLWRQVILLCCSMVKPVTSRLPTAQTSAWRRPADRQLSVSAWICPDVLTFPGLQSTGYIHWMGKGRNGQQEWVFRMYNWGDDEDNPATAQPDKLLVFNPVACAGVKTGLAATSRIRCRRKSIHVVGVADEANNIDL